ncbi:MAG: protein-L-isoaspartate(D-aspartate) O-methyltransferase [Pseudomonadota bacterium]
MAVSPSTVTDQATPTTRSPAHSDPVVEDKIALGEMILRLRMRGINDRAVLAALEMTPRRLFLRAEDHKVAYSDQALPIECGQVLHAPTIIARMVEALGVTREHRVLEIGTGSGYGTAILARLAKSVISVERYRTLIALAEQRLQTLKLDNVHIRLADGRNGHAEKAPYDRILVTGALPSVPGALLDQVKFGGVLVAPVGPKGDVQEIRRYERSGSRFLEERIAQVRFVQLEEGVAEAL